MLVVIVNDSVGVVVVVVTTVVDIVIVVNIPVLDSLCRRLPA